MIGLYRCAGDLSSEALLAQAKARLFRATERRLDRKLKASDQAVESVLETAKNLEGLLLGAGNEFTALDDSCFHGPVAQSDFPACEVLEPGLSRAYSTQGLSSGVIIVEATEVPKLRAQWRAFRRRIEETIVAAAPEKLPANFPPPLDMDPSAYRHSFSPVSWPPDRSVRSEAEAYRFWILPVDACLYAGASHGIGVVFRWERRATGAFADGVSWTVSAIDLDRVRASLATRDPHYYFELRRRRIERELERELEVLRSHQCKAFLLSQTVSSKAQAHFDEPETEAAAWYLLLSAGLSGLFDQEYAVDAEVLVDAENVDRLRDVIAQADPTRPSQGALDRALAHWGGPEGVGWETIRQVATQAVIPALLRVLEAKTQPGLPLIAVRCNRYDELW